jgi:hypothetical protein
VVVLVGAAAAGWLIWFRGSGGQAQPRHRAVPGCASARIPGRLGSIAWVANGRLDVENLDTCARSTLVTDGAAAPIRFSPDGSFVAYGDGAVVPVQGGAVRHPAGSVPLWAWSPSGHTLVGRGGSSFAVSPGGRSIAVGSGRRVELASTETRGSLGTIYVAPKKDAVDVTGWSPDGKWVLFFQLAPGAAEGQLNAAPISGAGYHNIFDPVLPYDDFLTWCGRTLVVSGGGGKLPSEGQQVLVSSPPGWRTRNLSSDFRSSWIWPSCSPDGRWIAVTIMPNHHELPPGTGPRRIELISIDGTKRVRLALGPGVFEAPRWSGDGRTLMVVERHRDPKSSGSIELVRVNPKTGKLVKVVGPIAELGPSPNERGHLAWNDVSDWYRPR